MRPTAPSSVSATTVLARLERRWAAWRFTTMAELQEELTSAAKVDIDQGSCHGHDKGNERD